MEATNKWKLTIERVGNGYILRSPNALPVVCEEDEVDELKHHEEMLRAVIEYFGFTGSKHDKERLRVIREQNE